MSFDLPQFQQTFGEQVREMREPSEWMDLKSRVEDEKFRKLSADLERRRVRRSVYYAEEEKRVLRELDNLQRDQYRFEREKQLRLRNSISSLYEKGHPANGSPTEVNTQLPMDRKAFGGSASLAFDPAVEKKSRSARKASKEHSVSYSATGKVSKNYSLFNRFPFIEEGDVQQFHKFCKSAAKIECRRWGEAWFYAKNEQEVFVDSRKRWTAVLLKSERERMKILSKKGAALMDSGTGVKTHCVGDETKIYGDTGTESDTKKRQGSLPPSFEARKEQSYDKNGSVEIKGNKTLNFYEAFILPQAHTFNTGESSVDETTRNTDKSISEDCQEVSINSLQLIAGEKVVKWAKKSRSVSSEENRKKLKETSVIPMPAIHELITEGKNSTSGESSKTLPRSKRTFCFLPKVTRET